jgi:hypothetical protein
MSMAGTGTIGKQLKDLETAAPAAAAKPAAAGSSTSTGVWAGPTAMPKSGEGPLMVVPAGFVGDLLGSLSGTIGEIAGGWLGSAGTGKAIGDALSDPIKSLVPFTIVPPAAAPQSAGPAAAAQGPSEPLVVVPAGFLGGLLGGIGGGLLGKTVGGWLGDEGAGESIGKAAGSTLGGILSPFSVVPPAVAPQSAGPDAGQASGEPMVVVPAGFFGDLLGGITNTVGTIVGGDTGKVITGLGSLSSLVPFHTVPPELAPQSAGPDGAATQPDLVVLPVGFLSSLLTGLAGTISSGQSDWAGTAITDAAKALSDVLPFHAVPPALQPQAAGPSGVAPDPANQLIVVPAGLFGNLLSGLAGTIGGAVGGMFGDEETGKAIGDAASGLISMVPFHTVPPAMVAN